jgi:hypothetical protein
VNRDQGSLLVTIRCVESDQYCDMILPYYVILQEVMGRKLYFSCKDSVNTIINFRLALRKNPANLIFKQLVENNTNL